MQAVLFRGCKPEVAAGPDGRIIGVGAQARGAAGPDSEIIRLRGTAWPGLIDSHIHLEGLADRNLTVDLSGAKSLEAALAQVRAWSALHFPPQQPLDKAAGGRPVFLRRKDGHSAWVSSAAMQRAGIDRNTED